MKDLERGGRQTEEAVQELESRLDDFLSMQEAHLKAMEDGEECDLEALIFERSRAFEDLKEHLSIARRRISGTVDGADPFASSIHSRLTDICRVDREIMEQLSVQRDHLAAELGRMSGMKKGLKGYADSVSMAARKR